MSEGGQRGWGGVARGAATAAVCLALAHCSNSNTAGKIDPRYGVAASPRVVEPGEPVPKGGGVYRVGKPYMVAGRLYYPEDNASYRAEGQASWYGADFHGRLTANGEIYDLEGISAAHPTLPLPSYARVTNLANGRSLIVRVNDRGPYHGNRVIDLSVKSAHLLGFHRRGTARVRVEYVGRAPIEGSDDRVLAATLRQHAPAPAPVLVASAKPFVPDMEGAYPVTASGQSPYGRAPALRPVAASELTAARRDDVRATSGAADRISTAQMRPAFVSAAGVEGTAQFMNGRGLY
jgi:rare lipoprotein A